MSTCPTVEAGSAGVTRSPAALWPATRSGEITLNAGLRPGLGEQAQGQRRRHQVGRARQPERRLAANLGEQLVAGVPDVGAASASW